LIKALASAGYEDLESLNGVDYAELIALPGVGPRTLERIQEQLLAQGMSLSGKIPVLPARGATIQSGHTGVTASDVKTHLTDVDPVDFIESLDTPRRVAHGQLLLKLFNRVTGARPKMWGPTMIGYGDVHYTSHTGREGDWFQLGFSPRKAKISLYGLEGDEELLAKLGKHTRGAGCVYINKPEDVDLDVLEEMIRVAWAGQRS
jgi:hypothetical protein